MGLRPVQGMQQQMALVNRWVICAKAKRRLKQKQEQPRSRLSNLLKVVACMIVPAVTVG